MKHPLTSPNILPTFDASFNDASSTGLLLMGGGAVLIAMGWVYDALHSWAWWGNVLTNVVLLLGTLIGMLMDFPSGSTTLFSNIIGIALSTVITVYLLKPSVRSQFVVAIET